MENYHSVTAAEIRKTYKWLLCTLSLLGLLENLIPSAVDK